jgi:hypothetical protein
MKAAQRDAKVAAARLHWPHSKEWVANPRYIFGSKRQKRIMVTINRHYGEEGPMWTIRPAVERDRAA